MLIKLLMGLEQELLLLPLLPVVLPQLIQVQQHQATMR
jgi:hypothetical protein